MDGGVICGNNDKVEASRAGSTVVDLSVSGAYKIIREGW